MKKNSESLLLMSGAVGVFLVHTSFAAAQGEPAAPEAPPAEAPAAEPAPPPAEPAPPTATTTPAEGPAVAPGPVPAPAPAPGAIEPEAAPKPAADEWKQDPVKVGIGLRAALRFQNPNSPKKLNDQYFDELYAEPRFDGKVTKNIAWQANFAVSGRSVDRESPGPNAFELRAMDLIGQFNFHDYFNVWAGRLLVASDRSNFSGPWFMSPWNYPGVYSVGKAFQFVGPKYKENGRDVGATVWGQFDGGTFKYFAGAYNLDDSAQSPLFSGRLNLSLLDKEPGYYSSSTYYGAKKQIVALGVYGQFQKDGTVDAADATKKADFKMIGGDALAEFDLNGSGVITGEGAFYAFDGIHSSPYAPVERGYYVLASYLFPEKIGWGKFQPLVRLQQTMKPDWTVVDGTLSYVVADYNMKIAANYQYTKMDDATGATVKGNAVQIGVQIQQ